MPLIPATLAALIESNVNSDVQSVLSFAPMSSKDPSYFVEMCTAIGTGIATGSPVITFTTTDSGFVGVPPLPGVGAGVGIVLDGDFLKQDIYTKIRQYTIEDFGKTTHDVYPPRSGNSGQVLLAISKGISDAVTSQFTTAWTLTSAHPLVYAGSGAISNGNFSGLVADTIKSIIVSTAPRFKGEFWPRMAQAIAESYVEAVEQHATGTVTIIGVCVPSPAQLCAIPGAGSGAGTAV